MAKQKTDNFEVISMTQYIDEIFSDPECVRMLGAEKQRFYEMNKYIENLEEHIRHFKNSGTTVKIEIMNQIYNDAASFLEYYTEE